MIRLIGAIIVSRNNIANEDRTPKDIDREFVLLFKIFDESKSSYLNTSICTTSKCNK
jgi:hypothetical protein